MAKKPKQQKENAKMDATQSETAQTAAEAPTAEGGQAQTSQPSTAAAAEPTKPDLTQPHVKKAIEAGLAMIKDGKSKADAARAMYEALKDEDKDLIVAAFTEGATLTEKGALTYWYNCKRKSAKS